MPLAVLAGDACGSIERDDVPEGIALVDSPDIDSIEHANRELTDRLAEAADLGIFVTTATRYADRVPWEVLGRAARPRAAARRGREPDAAGRGRPVDRAGRHRRGSSPTRVSRPRASTWSAIPEGAARSVHRRPRQGRGRARPRADRRARRGSRRAPGTCRARAGRAASPASRRSSERVADDLEHEAIESDALRRFAKHAFETEAAALRERLAGGTFLRAEALRQWQAFVGADEITRFFSSGIGRVRGTISALIRGTPRAPVAEVREDALADLTALARSHAGEAARRTATSWSEERSTRELVAADASLWTPRPGSTSRPAGAPRRRGSPASPRTSSGPGGSKRLLARGASVGVNAAGVGGDARDVRAHRRDHRRRGRRRRGDRVPQPEAARGAVRRGGRWSR